MPAHRRDVGRAGAAHCSAFTVALTRLCGLRLPRHLVSTFCTPATSSTARTPPPAITPVPGEAGLSSTWPAPNSPDDDVRDRAAPVTGTWNMFFLRGLARLADRVRDFVGLAQADADPPLLVAHRHDGVEREAPAALHHLGAAVDVDDPLDELGLGGIRLTAPAPVILASHVVLLELPGRRPVRRRRAP